MKTRLILILSAAVLLSGCATMSPENTTPDVIQQNLSQTDQTELNTRLNTIKDGQPSYWKNSEGNTSFDLTTSNTHVNGQGLPCRNYTLVIDRDYHRTITTSAIVCREDGQWKNT